MNRKRKAPLAYIAGERAAQRKNKIPYVRPLRQQGPSPKDGSPIHLFLDDVRNPPLHESNWVVVRSAYQAIMLVLYHGDLIEKMSLDNDLGEGWEGYLFLSFVLNNEEMIPNLKTIIIHSGNFNRVRLMRSMLRGTKYNVKRKVPYNRIYPHHRSDVRDIRVFFK